MSDGRAPIARARDEFLDSQRGKEMCRISTLLGTNVLENNIYLRNRLEAAFIAGWNAHEEHVAISLGEGRAKK